jgi:hypothetical protein
MFPVESSFGRAPENLILKLVDHFFELLGACAAESFCVK